MPRIITEEEWGYWYSKVYGYFYRRVNSKFDTEELTCQTLNAFFLSEDVDPKNYGYLWGIAKNQFYTYLRDKNKLQAQSDTARVGVEKVNLDEDGYSYHFQEKMQTLRQCIQRCLKETDQHILTLCVEKDFSGMEVAEILNLSYANVRTRLSRAVNKLKQECTKIWLA